MKNFKKGIFLFLTVVMMFSFGTVMLFAGGAQEKGKAKSAPAGVINLEFWSGWGGPDQKVAQGMVDKFNKKFAGKIKVTLSIMAWNDLYTKLPVALRSGKGPDVGAMHINRIKGFAQQGMLLSLENLKEKLGISESDFVPAIIEQVKINHKLYSVPFDTYPLVMFWNKKLFKEAGLDPEKAPKTREEFISYAKKLTKDTDGDGKIDQWGTVSPVTWPHFWMWVAGLISNDGTLYNLDKNGDIVDAAFNTPAGIDALQFLVDLIYKYKVASPNTTGGAGNDAFKRGTVGLYLDGIWMLGGYKATEGLDFGFGPIPQLGSVKMSVPGGSHQLVIFKTKKEDKAKREASIAFIKWMSENSILWTRGTGGMIAARLSVQNSPEFAKIPNAKAIAKELKYIYFTPANPKSSATADAIFSNMNLALLNKKSVKAALSDAEKSVNEIFKEAKGE